MNRKLVLLALAVLLFAGMGAANQHKYIDGIEDGSSELNCESESGISVNTDGQMYGSNYLEWEQGTVGGGRTCANTFDFSVDEDGKGLRISMQVPQDYGTMEADDGFFWRWLDSGGSRVAEFQMEINDDDLVLNEGGSGTNTLDSTMDWGANYNITINDTNFGGNSYDVYWVSSAGSSGNLNDVSFYNTASNINQLAVRHDTDGTTTEMRWDMYTYNETAVSQNSPPVIDANTTRPSPSNIVTGDVVDTVVNATDPDGDPMKAWVTVFESGTQIVSDKIMSQPTTGNFQDLNTFTADEIDTPYNISFKVSDGTVNTTEDTLKFKLSNSAPQFRIRQPKNQTILDYDIDYDVLIEQNTDNLTNEKVTCDFINDSTTFRTVQAFENDSKADRTFTGTFRHDFGKGNFTASCRDEAGNKRVKSRFYTVDDINFTNSTFTNQTFETVRNFYVQWVGIGDMVDRFNYMLRWYNGSSVVNRSFFPAESGVRYKKMNLSWEIPLQEHNNSKINWNYNVSYNRTEFDQTTVTEQTDATANQTQFTWQGFYFTNAALLSGNNYTAGQNYLMQANFTNQTQKVALTSTNTYWRTGETVTTSRDKVVGTTGVYEDSQNVGSVTSGLFDQYNTSTELKISFNGDDRFITSTNETVGIEQVKVQLCSQFSQSDTVALNFTTLPENQRDTLAFSDLTGAFTVWKDPSVKEAYNFSSLDKQFHEFCIYPEDENLTVDNTEKLIQYEGSRPDPDDGLGFERRSYFLINETLLHTSTSNINLFMINETDSTTVEYQIENEDGDLATGIVVKIERYFESEDKHLVVSMIRTGSEGSSRTFLEKNEFYYQHRLFRDMEQVDLKEDQVIPEDNQFNFQIGGETTLDYYERKDAVSFSCTDANSYVNCSYSSDTEQLENVNLSVKRNDVVGQTLIDFTTATTTSGEVAVTGLNVSNSSYTYSFTAEFPEGTILLESGFLGTGDDLFGDIGLALSMFLMLGLGFAGIAIAPEAVIILSVLGVVATATVDIIALQMQHVFGLVLIAAVAVWRMMS